MSDPNPIPFAEWKPDLSDRENPTAEAKGCISVAGQYGPFPDIQNYGPASEVDEFTMVLLHFDGLDLSTTIADDAPTGDNHTWTASGNAHQDTGDKMFGPSSLLCDGTGDFVSAPDHSDFALGSSDFTIDCHFKCNVAGGSFRGIAGQVDAGATVAGTAWWLRRSSTNVMEFTASDGTNFITLVGTKEYTNALNIGWHHIAIVRVSNVFKMFIDGVQQGNNISWNTNAINDSGENLVVGRLGSVAGQDWLGWIDEFRISVGVARWTAGFATDNDAFTRILLHMDGNDTSTVFGDSALGSSAVHVWTAGGNAQIDNAQSKFGGQSGLFDGTGDFVATGDTSEYTLGTGDFTAEGWFNCNAVGGVSRAIGGHADAAFVSGWMIRREAANVMALYSQAHAGGAAFLSGTTQFTSTEHTGWHHVAVTRTGSTFRLFVDGLLEATATSATSMQDPAVDFNVAAWGSGNDPWLGWLDEFRLSVGINRFPVVAANLPDANTTVLLHCDGDDGDVTLADHAPSTRVWTAAGNAQIDTADKQFGTGSVFFDGTGDFYSTPDSADFTVGSGDFTVECWFKPNDVGGSTRRIAGQNDVAFTIGLRTWLLQKIANNTLQFSVASATTVFTAIGAYQYTTGTNPGWHHVACTRVGNVLSMFVDGVLEARTIPVATIGAIPDGVDVMTFGSGGATGVSPWFGWLDEFRFSVGVARYTLGVPGNGNDLFTKILIHFDGIDAGVTWNDIAAGTTNVSRNWSAAGNAQNDTADFKFGTASALFDGVGDIVNTADGTDFTLGTNDFTVDCWFKCVATAGATAAIWGQSDATPTNAGSSIYCQRNSTNVLRWFISDGTNLFSILSTTQFTDTINPGWHHMACVRTGDTLKLFINGVQEGGGVALSVAVNDASVNWVIGGRNSGATTPWVGWIDEFRLSIGVARWGADSFTTDNDAFTKILLHFNGPDTSTIIGDDNSGGFQHTWTVSGNAQIDTAQSKFGGASALFDGTGDIITGADHADYDLGADDWTVDCWFNCNAALGAFLRLCGHTDATATAAGSAFWVERTDVSGFMFARISNGSSFQTITGTTSFTNVVNPGWHHFALVRTGNVIRMFLDGVQEGGDLAFTATIPSVAQTFGIGTRGATTTVTPWNGWIDEFRLSVGIARWTTTFTPPTAAYGAAVFTPPAAAYGGQSFVPPTAAFAQGFSASLPTIAYGADAAVFEPPTSSYSFGGGAEDVVLGADTFYDSDTDPHIFFGDATRLYTLESREAVDISIVGGYSVGDEETWQFAQFGNNVVAVSENVTTPQKYVMGTSTFFGNLPGTPPSNATSVARVGDFLWMGKDYTVHWSAFNDIDDWVPDTVTQAGNQQLDQERGEIIALVGLDYAAIFQERAIRRAIYVGAPVIWDFGQDYVEKARGCIARNAAVAWGRIIFYASDDGFYAFDGQSSTPIGYGKVDSYFSRNLNYTWRHKISVGIDYSRKLVVWAWPAGSAQLPTDLLMFSLQDGRWTHDQVNLEFLFDSPAEPVTVDDFASIFPVDDLDSDLVLPDDIDSAAFDDRRVRLAAFQQDPPHRLGLFTGSPRAATIDTKEFELVPGRRGLLTEVWPLGDYPAEAVSTAIGYRRALSGAGITFTNPSNVNRVGYCPQRIDARFLRVRQQITAGADWRRAEGVHFTATPTGKR